MHRTGKMIATTMIAAAASASTALVLSTSAAAEPVPAPAPAPAPLPAPAAAVPGLPFLQQLAANPAAAAQFMQTFANVLGATAPTTAVTPAAPSTTTASVTVPEEISALPGAVTGAMTALPETALALPGAAIPQGNTTTVPPADAIPAPSPSLLPAALTDQLGVPGGLASLLPIGTPLAGLLPSAGTATAPALPAAPAAPVGSVSTPLSALP
ncbi:MAG: hypothetical protein K0U76_14130 [Actinomycetia bacterium]|nr:hypothetical protein [Actinomycetes bacterium]MCH9702487.1 hypothetical protein [Actinomycetes bacterium]MCH9759083.1 hypothetical protein [Actinomycetes bacterium]